MGSKPKATSSSTNGSAQAWAQPFASQGAGAVQSVFNQNQPGINQLTQTVQGQLVPDLMQRFQQGGADESAAKGYIGNVLGGQYLNSNPYMQGMINTTNQNVTNGVNSQFEGAGRYGSAGYAGELAKQLSNADNQLQYTDYNNQMGRMDNAAQLGLTSGLSDSAQAMSAIGTGAQVPYAGSSSYANALGALFNGGTSQSKQVGPSPIWGAIGAGMGALGTAASGGAFASDRRLKTKIEKVGEFADGLGIYNFAYKSNPDQMFRGVMADEVEKLRPQAFVKGFVGGVYDGVNYAAL